MRTHPARSGDSTRRTAGRRTPGQGRGWTLALLSIGGFLGAQPATAAWNDSLAQVSEATKKVAATGMDMTIVRPLAALRAGVGAVLLVPASLLASPGCAVNLVRGESCRPIFEGAYDVLVGEPSEYAFNRKLGEL